MRSDQTAPHRLAYLVHDIDDAAVRRRIDLFAAQGVAVNLGGFHRRSQVVGGRSVDCAESVINLGRTGDGQLARRVLAVGQCLAGPRAIKALCDDASVIVARNLEMLVLAWRVHRPGQRLVYECLDIHRLMLRDGLTSRFLRWLERRLLARTDLVIVSSPAFSSEYFDRRQGRFDKVMLVENKVPGAVHASHESDGVKSTADRHEAPIVIGWFGMLRCRRTLKILLDLAERSNGAVEVVIAGIPSRNEFPDFAGAVTGARHVRYLGPYQSSQLADLYAGIDFVWAIDYFEEGFNSNWLLPNRLYEGLAHGAIPIALNKVETGRWLKRHNVGLLIDDPATDIPNFLTALTVEQHEQMLTAVTELPEEVLYQTGSERQAITEAVMGYAHD